MNWVAMRKKNATGDTIPEDKRRWCLIVTGARSQQALCTGEPCPGESNDEFEIKSVNRRGITCPDCERIVHEVKSVKLS